MNAGATGLVSLLALVAIGYIARWWVLERARGRDVDAAEGAEGARAAAAEWRRTRPADYLVGFVTNFFDTLGIGSFAPTTAYFKLRARIPDEEIPGTLNAGQCLPSMSQALIFITIISVDLITHVTIQPPY